MVIGIHGLNNKPPHWLLHRWWQQSLASGLSRYGQGRMKCPFAMAYWAHTRYGRPLSPMIRQEAHERFIAEPFIRVKQSEPPSKHVIRRKILDLLERSMDGILLKDDGSLNLTGISDALVTRYFTDLDVYLKGGGGICPGAEAEAMQAPLVKLLKRHRNREILLIAHSMGSVIAYDVLRLLQGVVRVNTLVTIGSPLGLPIFIHRNAEHPDGRRLQRPPVPEAVTGAWHNLSDLHDPIAINYNLADDYAPNTLGVSIQDAVVENSYRYKGVANSHKAYGYLQCAEMARICHDFLRR